MVFKSDKLRGKIVECFGTVDDFSSAFGMTATTAGRKLSGKSEWTQGEIVRACELLHIPISNITEYFFTI